MTTKITFEIFNDTDTKQIDVKYEEFCKWVVDFSKGDYLEKIIENTICHTKDLIREQKTQFSRNKKDRVKIVVQDILDGDGIHNLSKDFHVYGSINEELFYRCDIREHEIFIGGGDDDMKMLNYSKETLFRYLFKEMYRDIVIRRDLK